jgi:hypothetical protein
MMSAAAEGSDHLLKTHGHQDPATNVTNYQNQMFTNIVIHF